MKISINNKFLDISNAEYFALLRNDFSLFIERSFRELNAHTPYLRNWHIEKIAEALDDCRTGKIKRLIINVPPRSLKSHCASIAFPAFLLGHHPSAQIICASYGQDLANTLADQNRILMSSTFYKEVFPTRLASKRQAVDDFYTSKNGCRMATSVGGVLTGRGADFIIVDDPMKPEEAASQSQRKAVNDWYDHTLITRLNNKSGGCIIVVMQRLHSDDLVGHIRGCGKWELLRFPAIAENDETHSIRSFVGVRTVNRKVGEALHQEREPLELLAQMRETQGEYHFAGQYQQAPVPAGGGIVKRAWLKFYSEADRPTDFELVFQSWDTASKATELSDYSVCTTWGIAKKNVYLLHVFRRRMDYPELKRKVKELGTEFSAKNIIIEDKASGTQLIQELRNESIYGVVGYEPKMDKVIRMSTACSMIENGHAYFPENAEWLTEYISELTIFPYAKYDDQADSTSQALDWVKERGITPGILIWIEEKYQRMMAGLPY